MALAFSGGDARFLFCMTNEPDYHIVFLDIARMKVIMIIEIDVQIADWVGRSEGKHSE